MNIKLDSLWTHLEATSFRRTFRPTRLKVYSAWRFVHSKAILGDLWWRFHNGRIVLNATTTSFESVVFVSGINGLGGKTDHDLFAHKSKITSHSYTTVWRHRNLRLERLETVAMVIHWDQSHEAIDINGSYFPQNINRMRRNRIVWTNLW